MRILLSLYNLRIPSFLPQQTKGLSLEEIDLMYQNTWPVKAADYRRRIMAGEVQVERPGSGNGSSEKV